MLNVCDLITTEYFENDIKSNKAIIICGPTASGKTSVSLEVAKRLKGEIISCDSMQIYKYMDIGTAKATKEEQRIVPHHMVDIIDPWENYSVFRYKEEAERCIEAVLSSGKVPIITGGTGLYVNSLIDNRKYEIDSSLGENEKSIFDSEGLEHCRKLYSECEFSALYDVLKKVDPWAAESIHENNTKRVFRALELYFTTGIVQKERNLKSVTVPSKFEYSVYCLSPERELLYERINKRVDLMVSEGLFQEVCKVYEMCRAVKQKDFDPKETTSLQAIGYKELIPLAKKKFDKDNISEDEFLAAIELIKQNSRHYAKRQVTWFKKTPGVKFISEIKI